MTEQHHNPLDETPELASEGASNQHPRRTARPAVSRPARANVSPAPALSLLANRHPLVWINPAAAVPAQQAQRAQPAQWERAQLFDAQDLAGAQSRIQKAAAFISGAFPQTRAALGRLHSPLVHAPRLTRRLVEQGAELEAPVLVKRDDLLPVTGSSDLRAALLLVLDLLEQEGRAELLLKKPTRADHRWRRALSETVLEIDNRGDRWLALALVACPLGCRVRITLDPRFPSAEWKVERARLAGAEVVPGSADAPAQSTHGLDRNFLLGYATAALELKQQFDDAGLMVDADRPLIVYLPGGDGLLAAALSAALRRVFGGAAHCLAGDSVSHPAFVLDFLTGEPTDLATLGNTGRTRVDAFTTGCRSTLALTQLRSEGAGCYTAVEEWLFAWLFEAYRLEGFRLSPDAAAGIAGVERLAGREGAVALNRLGVGTTASNTHHLVWANSGGLLPETAFKRFVEAGRPLAEAARSKRYEGPALLGD